MPTYERELHDYIDCEEEYCGKCRYIDYPHQLPYGTPYCHLFQHPLEFISCDRDKAIKRVFQCKCIFKLSETQKDAAFVMYYVDESVRGTTHCLHCGEQPAAWIQVPMYPFYVSLCPRHKAEYAVEYVRHKKEMMRLLAINIDTGFENTLNKTRGELCQSDGIS